MVKKQATLTTRSRHAETNQKIKAVQDLKWANEARAKQAENLSALEQDITNLEKAAALSIARMITYPR
ncbi:hypothetical protein DIV25_22545 [Escherichia coli]|nr:hypothetical protein DIV25_22545 [Escherichia coli]